jgi:hypothetical protein
MQTIFTKTLSDNRNLAVSYDSKMIVTLDGTQIGSGCYVCLLGRPQGDLTHYIDSKPLIGLTRVEAETIQSAIAEIRSADPRVQRNAITTRMQAELDNYDYHQGREDGGTGLRFTDANKAMRAYESIKAELLEFDSHHPELVAELKAEKDAKLEAARKFVENN